jgi:uncharacterized protein YidB (DUF937 family)
MHTLAERTFDFGDQKRFATLSGDWNPIHVDPVRARRTQAGGVVVHGIHVLLWALDAFASRHPDLLPLRGCRMRFSRFVLVGEHVYATVEQTTSRNALLTVSDQAAPRLRIALEFGEALTEAPGLAIQPRDPVPTLSEALDLTFAEMEGRNGLLPLLMTPANAAAEFPAASGWLGAQRIAALAASSYLVGMITPGLHSVYGELAFQTCSAVEPANALAYCVARSVPRFLSIDLQIAGAGITGLVKSLVRPAPVRQAAMGTLAGLVGAAEFASSLTLIAGGSRGLGELTAKLIAAGGGRVILTWQSGREDAERVAAEIRASGGACETLQYDARKPAETQLAALAEAPTHSYYFATPPIGRATGEVFSCERLRDFLAVYVDGFWQFAQALRTRRPDLTLFYPSSVFVTERPIGMTEYTMAKAAGEVLCSDMNASLHPLRVVVSRLPRLPTDQTAGLAESETASPIEIMLQVVREVQATRQN